LHCVSVAAGHDFADAPDDYRPMEQCAAECVRVHAEAGFTTIFWKTFAVRCEYRTRIGEARTAALQPDLRVSIGKLLERYDTLDAAIAEALDPRDDDVRGVGLIQDYDPEEDINAMPSAEDLGTDVVPSFLKRAQSKAVCGAALRKQHGVGEDVE